MQHFYEDHSAEKEIERARLIALVLGELMQRPVVGADVAQFNRFAVPSVLNSARGRPLTRAEAHAVVAHLQQPRMMQSIREPALPPPDYTAASAAGPQSVESQVAPFVDYTFSAERTIRFPAPPSMRTGKINNIPFSIFAPRLE